MTFLDVTFDVTTPSMSSGKFIVDRGVHGHVMAALLTQIRREAQLSRTARVNSAIQRVFGKEEVDALVFWRRRGQKGVVEC